jgi:hypothetical protein
VSAVLTMRAAADHPPRQLGLISPIRGAAKACDRATMTVSSA